MGIFSIFRRQPRFTIGQMLHHVQDHCIPRWEHDRRVTELLRANNKLVEANRSLKRMPVYVAGQETEPELVAEAMASLLDVYSPDDRIMVANLREWLRGFILAKQKRPMPHEIGAVGRAAYGTAESA